MRFCWVGFGDLILCGRCHSFLSELLTWPLTIGGPNAFSFSESGLCFVVRQKGKFGFSYWNWTSESPMRKRGFGFQIKAKDKAQ